MKCMYSSLTVFLFLSLLKSIMGHLEIPISQKTGNNTKCLKHRPVMPCRTLKYVLRYILTSNESKVHIKFIDQHYYVNERLQIHTNESRTLQLRLLSHLHNVRINCANNSHTIFDFYGPNLTLEFYNVTFENCGHSNADILPAITVNDTKNISFYSCTFRNNWSGAFFALNSDVHIEYSIFKNNSFKRIYNHTMVTQNIKAYSAGVGILFHNVRRVMSVTIFQTQFIENQVHVNTSKYYVAKQQEQTVSEGGAMHVTFYNKSKYETTINITSCYFEKNNATFGGGLLIEFFGNSMYNKIFITSTLFINNCGSQAGGAFLFSMWDTSGKTELAIVDSSFEENSSNSGSAIYVYLLSKAALQKRKDILLFKRVKILRNHGPAASGVKIASHIFFYQTLNQVPTFEDCIFANNTNRPLNGYAYLPSFIADHVNINFYGTNRFIANVFFGAILFSNSFIAVYGKMHFLGNIGLEGGAISMKNSQIVLHPGADLLFQENYATLSGGAINVVTNVVYHVGIIKNPLCFLVYSDPNKPPGEWIANITFLNNSAVLRGPAICIDSLMMCAWDSVSGSHNFKRALRWDPTFSYEGNVLCPDLYQIEYCRHTNNYTTLDIATFVSSLYEKNGKQTIETSPGEEAFLDIIGKDELNNSVFTVISDVVEKSDLRPSSWLNSPQEYFPIVPNGDNTIAFKYTRNPHFELPLNATVDVYYFDIFSVGRVFKKFTLYPQSCRPGFIQRNYSCICDTNKTGILGCTADGHYVQYKEGYWVGVVEGEFTVMPCPFGYCSCPNLPHPIGSERSGCFFAVSGVLNDSSVCANKRSGTLCGECQVNYTVGLQAFRCVPKQEQDSACQVANVISFFLTFLLCILVLYFNPGLDNELRGPLFFFQVLPLFFPPIQYTETSGTINVYNFVVFFASIFEFTIPFFGYFFSKCYLAEGQNNLDMLAWGYSSSIIALLVFVFTLFLSYKRIILIRRKNAVQCFWVLLIFMYSSLMSTSLRIVDCPIIQGKKRLFLQGSLPCYEGIHLCWSFVAYIILVCGAVIPILIVVFTETNVLKIAPHYLDTLRNNLKAECQYWWSVDLFRRYVIVALGVLIHVWKDKQVALIFATMFIMCIHCYLQPYEETRANISEMVFLFVLCGFGVFQLLDISDAERDRTNFAIVCIMLSYTLIIILIKLFIWVRHKKLPEDSAGYESLGGTTMEGNTVTDQSLEERREKLAFLFARSRLSQDSE